MGELTHFNKQGRARMVDVTEKAVTHRRAVAAGEIRISPETMVHIKNGTLKKGDVLAVAQVAGIQAAKHNWELIPMCHPLPIQKCSVDFETDEDVPQAMLASYGEEVRQFIEKRGDKYHLDLKAINAMSLNRVGVTQIEISDACTYCQCDRFWSHRASHGERGSQGAVITCKEVGR